MSRLILATALAAIATTASAQENPADTQVPQVATEIVIEGLTLNVKTLRIGVALSPTQVEGIVKALQGTGAKIETSAKGAKADD